MSDKLNVEQRLVELESNISFQEHMIDELNGVVTSQQEQIDKIENELVLARGQMKILLSGSGDTDGV